MKISDLEKMAGLRILSGSEGKDNEITGCYVSDLLSDVMGNAREGELWITLQTHQNIVAVASLKELSGIIIVRNHMPENDTILKSNEEKITILSTELDTFSIAGKLYELLRKE